MATITKKKKKAKSEDREMVAALTTKSKNKSKSKSKSEERDLEGCTLDMSWYLRGELKSLTKTLDKLSTKGGDEKQLSKTTREMKSIIRGHMNHYQPNQANEADYTILLGSLRNTLERINDTISRVPEERKAIAYGFIGEIITDVTKAVEGIGEFRCIKINPYKFKIDVKILTLTINHCIRCYLEEAPGSRERKFYRKKIEESKDKIIEKLGYLQSLQFSKDKVAQFSLEERLEDLKNNEQLHSNACDQTAFMEDCISKIEIEILKIVKPEATNDGLLAFEDASPSIRPEPDMSLEERLRRTHIEVGDHLGVESRDEPLIQSQSEYQDELHQESHSENHADNAKTNQQNLGQENHPDVQSAHFIQCQRGIQSIIESFDNEQERQAIIEQFKLRDLQNLLEKKLLSNSGMLFT